VRRSYDNALAETIIGLDTDGDLGATSTRLNMPLEWVDWFHHRRLLEPIGHVPPAELEMVYDRQQSELARAA
jgi:transposase InsO family protein